MATNNYDAIECSQEETWGVPVMTTSKTQLEMILDGQAVIKSYIGTSQYQQGSSTSACGLASMNAVKAVLHAERDGCRGPDLVSNILSKELVAVSASCCIRGNDAHEPFSMRCKYAHGGPPLHPWRLRIYIGFRGSLVRFDLCTRNTPNLRPISS